MIVLRSPSSSYTVYVYYSPHNNVILRQAADKMRDTAPATDKKMRGAGVGIRQRAGSDVSLNLIEFKAFFRKLLEINEFDSVYTK